MENAFAPKIESANKDTVISDLGIGPQVADRKSINQLSEPFSESDLGIKGSEIISEVREKRGVFAKKTNFSEQENEKMLKEAMEYIARGWVFGLDKLLMTATPEFISSAEFQEAVRVGILTAFKEDQADNALNIKDMYLEDLNYLEDPDLREAATSTHDKYVKAGNMEMADKIRNEFLLQDKGIAA